MGSASTKFRKHLQAADEVQALQLYRTNAELRKALDPNCSYGDSHHHETPLHLASKHGMQMLLGIFLFSKAGNPNKTNARKETCLHCLCQQYNNWQSVHCNKRRAECLNYLLKWRGARLAEGSMEKIDLAAQDEKLNTALHYAAASGLSECVEILIQQGAPLFVENEDQLTPCDTAERNGHNDIALYLESKMVFSNDEEPVEEEDDISMPPMEEYSGLRPQDLQEAKDMLLVETADMLSVPLFTAEALLRNHEWSRETLLESWMMDPVACCEKCGVTPPCSLFSDRPEVQENLTSPLPSPLHSAPLPLDAECDICANTFLIADEPVHITCSHKFCRECWERYLNMKIQEGDAHHITCPAYECTMLVPVDIIEGIVSRDMARRYLQFDIKAFVDSNPDMKWCPFPRCGRAVKLQELDTGGGGHASRASGGGGGEGGGSYRPRIPSDTSRGVDCGGGHYFCWECLEESHEPCSCPNWRNWFGKIADVKPETLHDTEQETEVAANCLWLVTNSKPCPNCKSPIQKNEGCNHMKCSKCRHDFCWVCLEPWRRHNSSTGGYFMCNRYEVVKKIEEQNAQILTEAESKNKNMQELNRFVHYYTRFKNHENSFKLEEPLCKTAKDKMMILAEAVTDSATAQMETKFVEDAVQQLLKARRVLKCSYVYGYYLDGPGYKRIVFEFMQTELEECTEILSQMVNRLYLRTPRRKIIDQAHIVQRKRQEFIMAISKGLVPAETPPSVRKKRKKKKKEKMAANEVVDEDLHRAIVESIKEVDPSNPWIKDASGKHTNVVALLDWPSEDSDDSDNDADQKEKNTRIGKCHRAECHKLKAKNPRTKEAHDYCSRWCMLTAKEPKNEEESKDLFKRVADAVLDEHVELMRALEMSRLHYLQETGLLLVPESQQQPTAGSSPSQIGHKHRPRSNSTGQDVKLQRPAISSMEDFDIELQRFQELSAGFPKGDSQMSDTKASSSQSQQHSRKPSNQTSRFDENKSTIVTRVPNKSVEDLYCLDPTVKCSGKGQVGFGSTNSPFGSSASPSASRSTFSTFSSAPTMTATDNKPFSSSSVSAAHTSCLSPLPPDLLSFTTTASTHEEKQNFSSVSRTKHEYGSEQPSNGQMDNSNCNGGLFGTMFGAIKDLSVSNIHSSESDKTKDFTSKDLASIFASLDFGVHKDEEVGEEFGMGGGTGAGENSSLSTPQWGTTMPRNDLSSRSYKNGSASVGSSDAAIDYSIQSGAEVSGKKFGFSFPGKKSTVTKAMTTTDKGKCRLGEGRRKVKGESGRRDRDAMENWLTADASYNYSGGRERNKSSSPKSFYRMENHPGMAEDCGGVIDKTNMKKGIEMESGAGCVGGCGKSDLGRGIIGAGGEEGEVSLLRMAENLVQMTADVHLRMKEVEKGIRDLDSRSKLKSLKRVGGGGGGERRGFKNVNNCDINDDDVAEENNVSAWTNETVVDGGGVGCGGVVHKGCDITTTTTSTTPGATGGECVGGRKRLFLSTNNEGENLSVSSDVEVEDVDQWFDVPDIVPVEENISVHPSALASSNPTPPSFPSSSSSFLSSSNKNIHVDAPPSSLFNNFCNDGDNDDYDNDVDDNVGAGHNIEMDSDNDNGDNNTAVVELDNDLSITSADISTSTAYSKKSYINLGLRLYGNNNSEQQQQQQQQQKHQQLTDEGRLCLGSKSTKFPRYQASRCDKNPHTTTTTSTLNATTTTTTTTTSATTQPFFQSLLLKSPELSDNLLPSFDDQKDFSNSTKSKDLSLSLTESDVTQGTLGNVFMSPLSPQTYCDNVLDYCNDDDGDESMFVSGSKDSSRSWKNDDFSSSVDRGIGGECGGDIKSISTNNVMSGSGGGRQSVLTTSGDVGLWSIGNGGDANSSGGGCGSGKSKGKGREGKRSKVEEEAGKKSKKERGGGGEGKHRKEEEEFLDSVYV